MPVQSLKLLDDSLARNLARYSSDRLQAAVAKRLDQLGEAMAGMSFDLVPVDTGYLQSTIYWTAEGLQLEFGATADYAAPVEYGTWKMAAQPYLRPAWDGIARLAEDVLKDVIAEALK